jgi:hypothetical protein
LRTNDEERKFKNFFTLTTTKITALATQATTPEANPFTYEMIFIKTI